MGEEKFYSPREDLELLIASILTLDTSIGTLDDSIQTLITAFMLPSSERKTTGTAANLDEEEEGVCINEILSATEERYITKIRIRATSGFDFFLSYKADILYYLTIGGVTGWESMMCDGQHPAFSALAADNLWFATRMFTVDNILVPAGATLVCAGTPYNTGDDISIVFDVWHRKGLS